MVLQGSHGYDLDHEHELGANVYAESVMKAIVEFSWPLTKPRHTILSFGE